ncbi:glycosyltransferase [Aliikangiella sp. IMCC44653]
MESSIKHKLRNSKLFSRVLEKITLLPLTRALRVSLCITYLQCDTPRKKVDQVLARALKLIDVNHNESEVTLPKSAVIKSPVVNQQSQVVEKGVMIVGFEHELDRLISSQHFNYICDHYDVLFLPTWQPFYSEALLRFIKTRPESFVLLPSSQGCYFSAIQNPKLGRTLPFHASSWVDGSIFPKLDKDIDILMVANFAHYKRHYLLFEALKTLPSHLNVVLVGRQLADRSSAVLLKEAESYGVKDKFRLIESPTNEKVREYLGRAKLVLGLSQREGSYVSLAESLFAGTPVAVYADAVVGTKNYVNPETGFLLQPDRPLASQILKCLELADTLDPRRWALSNIDTMFNVKRMNSILAAEAKRNNKPWTTDCSAFRIQNFEFEPMQSSWPTDIFNSVQQLKDMGINLPAQFTTS